MLIYKGKLDGIRKKEYQGDITGYLQFVQRMDDDSLGFLEIKISDSRQMVNFEIGKDVEVPVLISAMDGKVFYRTA